MAFKDVLVGKKPPKHCAAGLRRAYVSGQLALRDGEMCKTRAGRVLRRDDKKG